MLSSSNARLTAARRLTRRSARRSAGRFLAEGPQAVREALAAGAVVDVYATEQAAARYPELTGDASVISARDAAALSETVTPQGLIAVCRLDLARIDVILARTPRLLVVLVEPADPGNLGTVIRTADAAGADAVIVTGGADAFGGKAVRASAGSVFHLPLVEASLDHVVPQLREAGIAVLAAAGSGDVALGEAAADAALARPHAWMFGSEAHGLGHGELAAADTTVRVPIYGRAESLNLAAAAAVCLYASAGAQRRSDPVADGSP